ncbi:MAG: hypothetical protein WCA11_16085, partial [Terracidiphilus sp.]
MKTSKFRAILSCLLPCLLTWCLVARANAQQKPAAALLQPESYHHYFTEFAEQEQGFLKDQPVVQWPWFVENIPWLDLPDKDLEQIYYFRWYAFQKHIRSTPDGFIIDEFLDDVPWAGKYNSIDAAAADHLK